ncbi:hypothetical protein C8N24_5883 [Solirubrobacter pauli]|uniref:Uncharacterized protein n=1 Tax=Solirubrobacter pauli TaxID=166793 RepID=A0A660L1I3_9ACTN|nr:hypothetical protein [Solirubrobacter pauli]RKQ87851.1 hypothetical protein C8N24_5883 [Solirubrobacter pauli]
MRSTFAGLIITAVMLALVPSAARADDTSLRKTVATQAKKWEKAAKRYANSVKGLEDGDEAKLKSATRTFAKATRSFHGKVEAEEASSSKLRTARTKLLDGLETYDEALDKLIEAIDADSKSKLRSAQKKADSAEKKLRSAAKAFS